MKAEQITKGSTLLATLNNDNFPCGSSDDLKKELHEMINKALNYDNVSFSKKELEEKNEVINSLRRFWFYFEGIKSAKKDIYPFGLRDLENILKAIKLI